MKMHKKIVAAAVLALFTVAFVVAPSVPVLAQGKSGGGVLIVPVSGTGPNGPVSGTFRIEQFANQGGQLAAIGTLVLTDSAGAVTAAPITWAPITPSTAAGGGAAALMPAPDKAGQHPDAVHASMKMGAARAQAGTCPILSLTLGPLHLNLLGLVIDLNQVVLNITAQSGNGNLLGNLLCSVAGLLNPGGTLQNTLNQLVGLLNQILAAL